MKNKRQIHHEEFWDKLTEIATDHNQQCLELFDYESWHLKE